MRLRRGPGVSVIPEFHPSVALLYDLARHVSLPPGLFFVASRLLDEGAAAEEALAAYLPAVFGEILCRHLRRLQDMTTPERRSARSGFECWLNVTGYHPGQQAYLHMDTDEALRKRTGRCRSPIYGSILFLGPAGSISGGETLFLEPGRREAPRCFALHEGRWLARVPGASTVPVRPGKLILFEGDLMHAVLPIAAPLAQPRITLLANYWRDRISSVPEGVCGVSPPEYQRRGREADRATAGER